MYVSPEEEHHGPLMDDDHYECATCGQLVYMGDLAAVMFHEHRGITGRVDLSGVEPGARVDSEEKGKFDL